MCMCRLQPHHVRVGFPLPSLVPELQRVTVANPRVATGAGSRNAQDSWEFTVNDILGPDQDQAAVFDRCALDVGAGLDNSNCRCSFG